MKKTIEFVDAAKQKVTLTISCEDRKKGNHVIRDWETLEPVTDGGTFSISGDCGRGSGQCYDEIVPTPTQKKIIDFWKTYHLNTMRAGTRKQMEALERIRPKLEKKHYGWDRWKIEERYLRFIGLLYDRDYKFGSDWLYRPFPKDELDKIILDIETEEHNRREALYEQTEWEVDDPAHEDIIINWILENADVCSRHEAYKYLALAQECNLEVAEIADIHKSEYNDNIYVVQGTEYYAGTDEELEDIAREYLTGDNSLWIDAIQSHKTTLGLDAWAQEVIDMDGPICVLNTYNGTSNEYDFCEYNQPSIIVCRA